MGVLVQKTYIRGLHVYVPDVQEGDQFTCKLDMWWMNEHPHRYSIAVFDIWDRKVLYRLKKILTSL